MAKKKKKRRAKQSGESFGKYVTMVNQGRQILNRYWDGERMGNRGRFGRIHKHYSRDFVQQAMFEYARGRKIAVLRRFTPLFPALKKPEDILPLVFYLAGGGHSSSRLWPSMHGTITRNIDGQRLLDLVLEVDFKPSWKTAFASAYPLVKFLRDFGVDFKVKFSGNSSPHIIVPAEAFPPGIGQAVHIQIMDYANKHVRGRGHLDMSFRNAGHFLRLAYSINENAGGVSVPIHPDPRNPHAYEDFTPDKAKIENVKVIKNWWYVPEDAPERTSEMIKFVLERKSISIPQKVRVKMPKKIPARQFQQLPVQLLLARGPKARIDTLRRLQMPYEQMLKTGRDLLQRRHELMDKPNVQEALEMLKAIHKESGVVSTQEASSKHEVAPEDLWFLWRWHLRERIFDYYAREDVQEAMFLHSMDRETRLGNGEVVTLSDPADILPLAVYIHETQGAVDYPTFYGTNTKYDVTTGDTIDCDVVVRIDGKGDGAAAERMAKQAISLLRQAGADFALLLGVEHPASSIKNPASSIENPVLHIIIPSEAVPGMPRNEDEFARTIETMEGYFKKALPQLKNISVLPMGEYIPLFYSVNETSGSANIPVRVDKLDAEQQPDSLTDVRVMRDWWDVPGEVSAEMEELFARIQKDSPQFPVAKANGEWC